MKYRKKPVVIEAYQLGSSNPVPDWFMDALTANIIITHANDEHRSPFDTSENFKITATIKTLEGDMFAANHDFIIRGANGELYPCKPEIFAKTYEDATTNPDRIAPLEAELAKEKDDSKRLEEACSGLVRENIRLEGKLKTSEALVRELVEALEQAKNGGIMIQSSRAAVELALAKAKEEGMEAKTSKEIVHDVYNSLITMAERSDQASRELALKQEIARLTAEVERLKAENHRLLIDFEKQSARADRTEKELAIATAPHVDDAGNVWHVPTAWAYAQACNGRNTRAERAEAEVARLRELVTAIAEGSQLCRDEPKYRLPEEICDSIRALATRQEEEGR